MDYKLTKISDNRIANCTDQLDMAVFSSGSDITKQAFTAISATNSNWTFNIPIGSQSLILDRAITNQADVYFTLYITGIANGNSCLSSLGTMDSLGQFPLNSLFQTSSCTINSSSSSIQSRDIVPQILRMCDQNKLAKSNQGTPAYVDKYYYNYIDGNGASNNALGDLTVGGYQEQVFGRGAFPITIDLIQRWALADAARYPAGAVTDNSPISANGGDQFLVKCHTTLIEPLIGLAPWLFEDSDKNSMGIYGVQTCTFNMTIDQSLNRFWSSAVLAPKVLTITLGQATTGGVAGANGGNGFANVQMNMTFLSPQPSDAIHLPLKNIVPYTNYSQVLTAQQGANLAPAVASDTGALVLTSRTITSNTITLSVIPDQIWVCCRVPMANKTINSTNSYFVIQKVVAQFANKSGIFSNLNSFDLNTLANKNGLQQGASFLEWNGVAMKGAVQVPTSGSFFCFSPIDMGLDDMHTCGSSGQYTFSIQVTVANQSLVALPYELAICTVESGLFITQEAQSMIQIGVLSSQDVLSAKENKEVIPSDNYQEQTGGASSARMRTAVKHFRKHHHNNGARHQEEQGSGMSAGNLSAGRRHGLHKYIR